MAVLILAFAVGSAASGVAFYSYYEFKKDQTEERVATFLQGFDRRFKTATETIQAERQNAVAEIQKELEPLRRIQAEGGTLETLVEKAKDSVFFVSTLDENGQPSVGTAFAVASDSEQTLLLTSYNTVRAATRAPRPGHGGWGGEPGLRHRRLLGRHPARRGRRAGLPGRPAGDLGRQGGGHGVARLRTPRVPE
jgi:hypothetical protein